MEKTTKADLIVALSEEHNLSTGTARGIIETILATMSDALGRGQNIELRGFGTFKIKQYSSYTGRNPKNGKLVTVRPKKLPVFTVGKELKKAVDENRVQFE